MRTYIRHPAEIPVQIKFQTQTLKRFRQVSNVSYGGLAFDSDSYLEPGTQICICIDVVEPCFEAEAIVSYCRAAQGQYQVGAEFIKRDDLYIARMVEQICHIEQYRQLAEREGRKLTSQQAAAEWISKFASHFPRWAI